MQTGSVTHYNIEPTLDLYPTSKCDLGGVALCAESAGCTASSAPNGAVISLHGQIEALHEAFSV